MAYRIGNLIIAIALFLSAIQAFTKKEVLIKSFMPKANLDFGYLWLIVGILCLCLSLAFLHLAFRSEKNIKKYIKFTRCQKCKKIYNFSDTKDMICPKCGGDLQDYAEFEKEQENKKQDEFKEANKFQEKWIKQIKEERKKK